MSLDRSLSMRAGMIVNQVHGHAAWLADYGAQKCVRFDSRKQRNFISTPSQVQDAEYDKNRNWSRFVKHMLTKSTNPDAWESISNAKQIAHRIEVGAALAMLSIRAAYLDSSVAAKLKH